MSLTNLGTLDSDPRHNFFLKVDQVDPTDVFKFSIDSTRNINLSLNNITSGDDADLRLYRDVNGDGQFTAIDRNQGLIAVSTKPGFADDAINVKANTGTYFAEVSRFAAGSTGEVFYNFDLSATKPGNTNDFSNLLPKEFDLGRLTADVTNTGRISDTNTADVYKFSIGSFQGVDIRLTGLSSDADIRLIRDFGGDQIVDPGEEVSRSINSGTASELISNIRDAGTYYLQVNQFSGTTPYTLTFDQFSTPEA